MLKIILVLNGFLMAAFIVQAAAATELTTVSDRYRKSKLVQMTVEKTVKEEVLGKETTYKGKMFISGELFRWSAETPEKALVVFDGTYLWSVQYPSPDFPGDIQYIQSKIDKNNRSQILPATILSKEPILNNFEVLNEKPSKNIINYELKSKNKNFPVQNLQLQINKDKKWITQVSYKDDLGNSITLDFSEIQFKDKISAKTFKYTPEKGAKATKI